MSLFEVVGVRKEFTQGGDSVVALDDVDLSVESGELVVVTGESGSGKTTLLSILGALDTATRGSVIFNGIALESASSRRLATVRLQDIGFVFQDFLLVRHLSVLNNVRLPMLLAGADGSSAVSADLLDRVGMGHRLKHSPDALSRGEMQRVAIARALVNNPRVLLADEPTANLDRSNAGRVLDLLFELHAEGLTVVVATHSPHGVQRAARAIHLEDGRIAQ